MAVVFPTTNIVATGSALLVNDPTEQIVIVTSDVILASSGSTGFDTAIRATTDGHVFQVDGLLASSGGRVVDLQGDNVFELGASGRIVGESSGLVAVGTGNIITINGSITADGNSISMLGGADTVLVNGSLTASGFGVSSSGAAGLISTISFSASATVNTAFDGFSGSGGRHIVTNAGTINAGDDGMSVSTAGNTLTNTGQITAENTGMVFVNNADNEGSNSGTIVAEANGVRVTGSATGTEAGFRFTNSGDITANADGANIRSDAAVFDNAAGGVISAQISGIVLDGNDGMITNHGTITGETGAGVVQSAGNSVFELTNTGSIVAGGSNGVFANSNSTIDNSGTIQGATGIFADDNASTPVANGNHQIVNSGTVIGATSSGIHIDGNNSLLDNSGEIVGDPAVDMEGAGSQLVNTGTITGQADSIGDRAVAFSGADGIVANHGTISGAANGLQVETSGSTSIVNTGAVLADRDAVYGYTEGGQINLTNSGTLTASSGEAIDFGTGATSSAVQTYVIGNSGQIVADSSGIRVLDSSNVNTRTFVTNSGDILSDSSALSIDGEADIVNTGTISGLNAIDLDTESGAYNSHRVVNEGTIFATSDAIRSDVGEGGRIEVINSGTIRGEIEFNILGTASGGERILANTGLIENSNIAFSGTYDVDFVRNAGTIVGDILLDGGNDTYDGRGGSLAGYIAGGAGDDTYIFDAPSELPTDLGIVENVGEGFDTVQAGFSTKLGDNLEALVLTGGAGLRGEGNLLGNLITGTVGADTLLGVDGDDTLEGGSGGDVLEGGNGNDTVDYTASEGWVNVSLLTGFVGGGVGSHAIGDTFTSIENIIGSRYDDRLNGDNGVNLLEGGQGDDFLRGRGGADTIDGGNGSDTADYADSSAFVNVSLLTGFAGGGLGSHAVGDTWISIENFTGSNFADRLNGDNNDNILEGRAGADTINGNGGSDTASYASSAG